MANRVLKFIKMNTWIRLNLYMQYFLLGMALLVVITNLVLPGIIIFTFYLEIFTGVYQMLISSILLSQRKHIETVKWHWIGSVSYIGLLFILGNIPNFLGSTVFMIMLFGLPWTFALYFLRISYFLNKSRA